MCLNIKIWKCLILNELLLVIYTHLKLWVAVARHNLVDENLIFLIYRDKA